MSKSTTSTKSTTAAKKPAARKATATKPAASKKPAARKPAASATAAPRAARVAKADLIGSYRMPPLFVSAAKLQGEIVKGNNRVVYIRMNAAQVKAAKAAADKLVKSTTAPVGEVISARAAVKAIAKGPRK